MRVPTFLVAILFVLVVVTGCNSGMSTQPIITNRVQTIERERLEMLHSLGTDRQVINNVVSEDIFVPDVVAPAINWIVALRGYWLAEYMVGDAKVEVLFIIREDSTFSSGAALNGSQVTKLDYGIWKFDTDLLRISFKTTISPDWKVAVFYGKYFTCLDNSFYKQDELPEWATN